MRPSSIVALMLLGLGQTATAWADDPATDSLRCEAARADAGPPPPFVSARRPLDSDDLALKKEGVYPTGIPLFGSDPDTGWGFGVQGFLFWDGPCADPLFPYAPYQHKLSLQ